jgi:hypothetical protein
MNRKGELENKKVFSEMVYETIALEDTDRINQNVFKWMRNSK